MRRGTKARHQYIELFIKQRLKDRSMLLLVGVTMTRDTSKSEMFLGRKPM